MANVTIIGGGPAGCATALALHANGITDVTVVEAGFYAEPRFGESIPPDIGALFAKTGILNAFLEEGHESCVGSCSSWGNDALGYNDFIANPHGSGWHLDRQRFESFLAQSVSQRGMRLLLNTRFCGVDAGPAGQCHVNVTDELNNHRKLKTDFLFDASGMRAQLATRFGARRKVLDKLLLVCAFIELGDNQSFSQLTMLEAVEYGWWYAARLPDRRAVVAVASDAPSLKARHLNQADSWQRHLQQTRHLFPALQRATWPDRNPAVLVAASTLLEPCRGPDWLAVGDAASCYDPITSMGIYKAFANAVAASRAVLDHLDGKKSALDAYEEQIRLQFSDYLDNRQYFYELEQRWPDSDFWSRRQQKMEPLN